MKKRLTSFITAIMFVSVSLGNCFAVGPRRRDRFDRRHDYSQKFDSGSHENRVLHQEIFAVAKMLNGISKREICDADIGYLLDFIKEDFVDAYVSVKASRGEYDRYKQNKNDTNIQKKYITQFDQQFVQAHAQVMDDYMERRLVCAERRRDRSLDRAINLVLSRHVAVKAGARNLPIVRDALKDLLKENNIRISRRGRAMSDYGYDEYGDTIIEESGLLKALKVMLGVAVIGGAATGATYLGYRCFAKKDSYQKNKGFFDWLLPRNGSGYFTLESKDNNQNQSKQQEGDQNNNQDQE